jgi:hypothetical protein
MSLSPRRSTENGITATASGGQAAAYQLTKAMSRVTTVATAADSVKLPMALAGASGVVANAAAANAMNVFPFSGDAINALSANTALSVAANKTLALSLHRRWHLEHCSDRLSQYDRGGPGRYAGPPLTSAPKEEDRLPTVPAQGAISHGARQERSLPRPSRARLF